MECPARLSFDVARVLLHVHEDRSFQAELAVLNNDGVFVLRDAVDWAVEGPVEDDARRLAAESRIVFTLERSRGLCSGLRQFAAAVEPRPARRAASPASTCGPLAGLVVGQLIERH